MKCPVCGLGNITKDNEGEFCSECGSILHTPEWIKFKGKIKETYNEELIFVGEMGVDGVIDGKLPNGEEYHWTKKNRRRLKKPKG